MTGRFGLLLAMLCVGIGACGVAAAQPAESMFAWARQQRSAGQPELAVWLAKQAVVRASPGTAELPDWNRELTAWLTQDGRWAEAREAQQRSHAVALAAFLGDGAHAPVPVPPVGFDALEQAWSAAWPEGVQTADAAQAAALQLLALPRPRHVPRPMDARAAPGELSVHVLESPLGLALVMDGGAAVRVQPLAWPLAERQRSVGQVALALADPARVAAPGSLLPALQALYRRLGEPIDTAARRSGATRIVLHLGPSLRELPFAALHDGQAYLGERYAFRTAAPGAGLPAPDGPGPGQVQVRALGVSRAVAGWPALPGVASEVCAIVAGPVHGLEAASGGCGTGAGVVEGEAWLDQAFTSQRLAEAVRAGAGSGRAVLHLGTHFQFRPGRMAQSTVLLGDGSPWPLARLAALDFSGHALVALAACDTGGAGADAAESLQGLVLNQGAQAVLASLWRVDDRSTSLLMQTFYRHLATLGPVLALQRAQQAVRERPAWQAPFHWAGFVLASRS